MEHMVVFRENFRCNFTASPPTVAAYLPPVLRHKNIFLFALGSATGCTQVLAHLRLQSDDTAHPFWTNPLWPRKIRKSYCFPSNHCLHERGRFIKFCPDFVNQSRLEDTKAESQATWRLDAISELGFLACETTRWLSLELRAENWIHFAVGSKSAWNSNMIHFYTSICISSM